MPPKQPRKRAAAAKTSSCENPEKMQRLSNMNVNIENTRVQELERALNQKENDSRILHLAREVAKSPKLSPELTLRLLMFCAKVGSEHVARKLLNNQNIDLKTPEGGEALWAAIREGHGDIVALLIRAGVDLSIRDSERRTPLLAMLTSYGIKNNPEREELVRMMLNHGADVNACDVKGHSVLHEAINREQFSSQLVEDMLGRGAEVTINKHSHLDVLYAACHKKLELLPKLIEHQVPGEETRNNRAMVALHHLISPRYTGLELAQSTQMIKKILDLGVPVSSPHPFPDKYHDNSSVLHLALWCKKKDAIKLLLDYGADPHEKDSKGNTTLYRAASQFKGYTHASRWLIERGVSIHDRNNDGTYPLHGACLKDSLRNIHLFLNLGADLNVTSNDGRTPFSYTNDLFYFNEAHYLIIKHFALMISQGGSISKSDNEAANLFCWGNHHFRKCTNELEKMKVEKICADVTYFSLLSKNINNTIQLMKTNDFSKSFKRNEKKRVSLFPVYSNMLFDAFKILEKRYEKLQAEKELLKEAFELDIPDRIIENIAFHTCAEKFERCRYDYYMTLHANLKNTKTDKEKIL